MDDNTVVCQKCGEINPATNNFCHKCAAPLKVNFEQSPSAPPSYAAAEPIKKKKKNGCLISVVIVLCVFLVILIAALNSGEDDTSTPTDSSFSDTGTESTPEPTETPIVVTAADFYKAYEDNEVNADKLYKGKSIEITGVVNQVTVTLGTMQVILDDGDPMNFMAVYCNFKDSEEDAVAKLSAGDAVTIRGECTGKAIFPSISSCIIVD